MPSTTTTGKAVRTADLTAAQRKVLVALFGDLPEANYLALVGRKGTPKTQPDCECGCGVECPSQFVIGHDARLKSVLNDLAKGNDIKSPNFHGFTKADAVRQLAVRGW